MQLTCPNCAARYAVDAKALGETGRTVQCFRCGHRWFAPQPEPAKPAAAVPRAEPRPVPDFIIRPQAQAAALPAVTPDVGLPGWGKALIAFAIFVGLALGAVYAFPPVANALPEPLRELLGVRGASRAEAPRVPKSAAAWLQVVEFAALPAAGGGPAVVLTGRIVNGGEAPGTAERILVRFLDADGLIERGSRIVDLRLPPIEPGASAPFSVRLDERPADAAKVSASVVGHGA